MTEVIKMGEGHVPLDEAKSANWVGIRRDSQSWRFGIDTGRLCAHSRHYKDVTEAIKAMHKFMNLIGWNTEPMAEF